jgi:heme O synthase-like polyprenyltransferase
MRYFDDYQHAGLPTFPSRYGFSITRKIIAISTVLAALTMGLAAFAIGITQGLLHLMGLLSGVLLLLAVFSLLRPSEEANFALFKYASLYMIFSMLLIALVAL